MTVTAPASRDRVDACPGALQTHTAADGELARVRVPGGALTAAALRVLARAARELGDGHLELTSRGNVQLRGLGVGAGDLGERLAAAGLLPSATHERVRNILASVLSGRDGGGHLDVRPWVAAFDSGLCADPAPARLPGRFLTVFDDGRGDVAGLDADVGLLALDPHTVALLLGGLDSGLRTAPATAVELALDATCAFLDERVAQGGTAWRLTELADGIARVAGRLRGNSIRRNGHFCEQPVAVPAPRAGPIGAITQAGGRTALAAVVPLGRLSALQADVLAGLADNGSADLLLTPWRSVVVPDLPDATAADMLTAAGLVLDPASPWLSVTTCAGRPGCAKSLADVRADATAALAAGALPADGAHQHWAGCERRCGRPHGTLIDVIATGTGTGYRIDEDGR